MRKIVYYVAVSMDGFIEGPNKSSDKFIHEPSIVDYYLNDLKNYDTTIMGKNTYENGYKYGLNPVLLGGDTRLFGSSSKSLFLDLMESLDFDNGFKILTYNIKY